MPAHAISALLTIDQGSARPDGFSSQDRANKSVHRFSQPPTDFWVRPVRPDAGTPSGMVVRPDSLVQVPDWGAEIETPSFICRLNGIDVCASSKACGGPTLCPTWNDKAPTCARATPGRPPPLLPSAAACRTRPAPSRCGAMSADPARYDSITITSVSSGEVVSCSIDL